MAEPAEQSESATFELVGEDNAARVLRERYVKSEYQVPMRDGTRLFTAVYAPRDRSQTYPFLLLRTPFGIAPYGSDQYPCPANTQVRLEPLLPHIKDGYIFVYQDVRGRMMSEGAFVHMRPHLPGKTGSQHDESSDAYDTIAWLLRSIDGHNGRAGVWGVSYPGFYAAQAAIDAHQALAAVSPQAPVTDGFIGDDFHHHGAFFLADSFGFTASLARTGRHAERMAWSFDHGSGDVYDFFLKLGPLVSADVRHFHGHNELWRELMTHGTRDAYWRARDPRPHYREIRPAVLITGGWFDEADLFGTLATYRSMRAQSPRTEIHLAMGPWCHCGWLDGDGDGFAGLAFGSKTAIAYRERVERPFFRHYLKGLGLPPPRIFAFETGTNVWRTEGQWPPAGSRPATFWFGAAGSLRDTPPEPAAGASWDEYVSDPADPVPCHGRPVAAIQADYMAEDQRFATGRSDVLVYQTDALTEDLTLAGPIEAKLWVSVSGTDADFVVKLIDVHPQEKRGARDAQQGRGFQWLVRAEVMRGKFRNSYEAPEAFRPGEPALVSFSIPDASHTFRAGHRIMVHVQSSWFPLVDRNPQTFLDIYAAETGDFRPALHRLHRQPKMPSGIVLTVRAGAGRSGQARVIR